MGKKSKLFLLGSLALLSISASAILMMSTGCGKKKTVISFLNHKVEIDSEFKELCELYEKEHPDVKIEIQSVGGGSDYASILKSKLNSNAVDLFCVESFGDIQNLTKSGILENLQDMDLLKKCSPKVLDMVKGEGGEYYGLPMAIEGYGYLINKKMFNDAGVDTNKMTNFAGLKEGLMALKNKIDSGELKEKYPKLNTAFSMSAKASWSIGQHMLHGILAADFNSFKDAYKTQNLPFSKSEDWIEIINLQRDCSVQGEVTPEKTALLNAVDYSNSFDGGFLIGANASVQQGNWVLPQIRRYDVENKTNLMADVDMLPWSMPSDSGEGKYIIYPGQFLCVNKKSDKVKVDTCKDFLNWMYSAESAKNIVTGKMHLISPFVDSASLKSMVVEDNVTKKLLEAYASGNFTLGGYGLVFTDEFSQKIVGTAVQEYLANKKTKDELVTLVKNKWSEMAAKNA